MDQWADVAPAFADDAGDTLPRDFDGAGGLHYRDRSGRNDLVSLKVARDAENVYFHARTRQPLTPSSDPDWMWLLIDIDRDPRTGWEGYDFIVNRKDRRRRDHMAREERRRLALEARREGLLSRQRQRASPGDPARIARHPRDRAALSLDFKWADNLQHPGDVMDFYTGGDVAPEGRFRYRYVAE